MGTIIGSFIGGLLVIAVAVFIYKKISGNGSSKSATEDSNQSNAATDSPKPESELSAIVKSLIRLNITIRTTYGLASEITQKVENLIDLLNNTVPQMMDRYPSESLTYELKRISGEHLPQIVKEFMDLSEESRKKQHDSFITSLDEIRSQIKRANEIVQNNEVAEFKVMASFLKTKYSDGNV